MNIINVHPLQLIQLLRFVFGRNKEVIVTLSYTIVFNRILQQGQKPDLHAAKRIASTDTLGSDAALDQESNDSLYG